MTDFNKTISKIQALFAMAADEGASTNEKAKALEMAQKLMRQHQLTQTDINNQQTQEKMVFGEITYSFPKFGRSVNWMRSLIHGIGEENFVRCYYNTSGQRGQLQTKIKLFGTETDIRLVIYSFEAVQQQIRNECNIAHQRSTVHKSKFIKSFCQGAVTGFLRQLRTISSTVDQHNETTAIVLAKDVELNSAFDKHVPNLRTGARDRKFDLNSYMAGQQFGESININPAITTGKASAKQLSG